MAPRIPSRARAPRVRLVVPPGLGLARTRALAQWIRAFVPAVVLTLVPPGPLQDSDADDDTITIDADAVPSGPLSLADLLTRATHRR
jgi:hypothetical protein